METINIAIWASGSGSNAENIIEYFSNRNDLRFIILSNKKEAKVHERAKRLGVESFAFKNSEFRSGDMVLNFLKEQNIQFNILAGFLLLVPQNILKNYPNKIINIHPALLPKYGGKGMYGMNVHNAVIENQEKESGITIHYTNEVYDEGQILLQARCSVTPEDTPETLVKKIHRLEHAYYPKVVEFLLESEELRTKSEEL